MTVTPMVMEPLYIHRVDDLPLPVEKVVLTYGWVHNALHNAVGTDDVLSDEHLARMTLAVLDLVKS